MYAAPLPQNQSQIDTLQPAQLTSNLLALPSGFKLLLLLLFLGGGGGGGGVVVDGVIFIFILL